MKSKTLLAAGALLASHSVFAGTIDYSGYFRANTGANSNAGGQVCFGLNGGNDGVSKYRLGNECGVYGELQLGNEIAKTEDGSVFKATVMFSVKNSGAGSATLTDSNGQFGLPQVYLSAEKVPELGGGTAWMGRRYYKREDIHITDFFYWNPANNMGLGFGLEDLPVGNGMKFSYALFRDDTELQPYLTGSGVSTGVSDTRHDFQLRGLGVNPGGTLEFGLSLISKDSSLSNTNNGSMITVQHRQAGVFGNGENKFAVQWAKGSSVGANGGGANSLTMMAQDSSVKEFRIVEGLYSQLTNTFGGQLVAVYDKVTGKGTTDQKWTTLGGRIAAGLTPHIKLLADLGRDEFTPSDGTAKGELTKFTVALALSPSAGYYARPELRLFYTHANWNDAARALAPSKDPLAIDGVFGNATSGSVVGFTAESWW